MAARIVLALLVGACSALQLQAQRINGAWKLISVDGKSFPRESTRIFSDGYFMSATHTTDGAFEKAAGGTYSISGKEYTEIPDFNTADTAAVRKPAVYSFILPSTGKVVCVYVCVWRVHVLPYLMCVCVCAYRPSPSPP